MNRERNFTPLSEINNQGAIEVPIWERGSRYATEVNMSLTLPDFVPQDKIGIDLPAFSLRARTGGLRSVHVLGEAGEVSSYTPNVINNPKDDGTAIAGARGTMKKIETSSSSRSTDSYFFNASWADATFRLNTSEILQRMKDKKKHVRSAEGWSTEINRALQREIQKQGTGQLMGGLRGIAFQVFIESCATAQVLADQLVLYESFANALWDIPKIELVITGLMRGANAVVQHVSHVSEGDFRWSICAGAQIDRAAVLGVMTKKDWLLRTQSLVRPLSQKEKN